MDEYVQSSPAYSQWGWGPSALASNEEKEAYYRVYGGTAQGEGGGGQTTPRDTAGSAGASMTEKNDKIDFTQTAQFLGNDQQNRGYESRDEFRERREILRSLGPEARAAVRAGDTTYFSQGYVPIFIGRGDRRRKVLLMSQTSHTEVIFGREGSERAGSLPDKGGYYTAGLPSGCPMDIIGYVNPEPVNEGTQTTKAAWRAVRHMGCNKGVGNDTYDRFAATLAEADKCGFQTYWGQNAKNFAELCLKETEAYLWAYCNENQTYKMSAKQNDISVQLFNNSNNWSDRGIKLSESYLYGYTTNAQQNFRIRSTGSLSKCEVWSSSGPFATMEIQGSNSTFRASANNDFSYLTQTTLRIQYANGDSLTGNPGSLYVNYSSGAYSRLFGGGLYVNNGSNYVDVRPPYGKDAYFQQVEVCVNGEPKYAYVLMSQPE